MNPILRGKVDQLSGETGVSISDVCRMLLFDGIARLEAGAKDGKTLSVMLMALAAAAEDQMARTE